MTKKVHLADVNVYDGLCRWLYVLLKWFSASANSTTSLYERFLNMIRYASSVPSVDLLCVQQRSIKCADTGAYIHKRRECKEPCRLALYWDLRGTAVITRLGREHLWRNMLLLKSIIFNEPCVHLGSRTCLDLSWNPLRNPGITWGAE